MPITWTRIELDDLLNVLQSCWWPKHRWWSRDDANGDDDVKNHVRKEHAITYWKGGAVKEGQLNNVSVVAVPIIPMNVLLHVLFVLGIYPCAKGHVYKNNKTTDAIERRVGAYFGDNVSVLFVDAVLFSADIPGTNTKTFDIQKMLETLRDNPGLALDLFSRLCDQLRTWWRCHS